MSSTLSPETARELSSYGYKGDRRDGGLYQTTKEIDLALKIALTSGRPLLVTGRSGVGKSMLANYAATTIQYKLLPPYVVTSRSDAQDLLWRFDAVSRLAAAQMKHPNAYREDLFVEPGHLWWAFAPASAREQQDRYRTAKQLGKEAGSGSTVSRVGEAPEKPAVLLIDEIDKADPEFPNALLVPLGSGCFNVPPLGDREIKREDTTTPLVIITSNNERPLPPAFLRRCVTLALEQPDEQRMKKIAEQHFPDAKNLAREVVAKMYKGWEAKKGQEAENQAKPPSPPEILDMIAACDALSTGPGKPGFDELVKLVHGSSLS